MTAKEDRMPDALPDAGTAASAENLRAMGEACLRNKSYDEAQEHFEQALELNPADHRTLALLGDLALWNKDVLQALGLYMLAVRENPAEKAYKERFAALATEVTMLTAFSAQVKATLLACLQTPDMDCANMQGLWYLTFVADPAFKPLYRLKLQGGFLASFSRSAETVFSPEQFDACRDYTPLLQPLFLLALEKLVVYALPFEAFLTRLRRALLDDLDAAQKKFGDAFVPLAAALSHYCFYTEYIFDLSAAETQKIEALRARLESGGGDEMETAVYACYAPLHTLGAACPDSPALAGVVRAQVADHARLMKKRGEIEAVTPVAQGVSAAVREQYEESPYPKWRTPREFSPAELYAGLRGKAAQVLVAGCGTGAGTVNIARMLPDASVLGVDLSRTSLAYGAEKAEELGLENVSFRQGDILLLGALERRFDAIVASGVLHHMEDPLQGWRVLAGLLKPEGIMRVSLYSEKARAAVVKARAAIAKGGYPSTPAGMRRFRADIGRVAGKETRDALLRCTDYFQMSMFRDLLFHVQEHRFTVPRIKESLDALGLAFVRFLLPDSVLDRYRAEYPEDPEAARLDNWDRFEKKYPGTFIYMYQFWCRKK